MTNTKILLAVLLLALIVFIVRVSSVRRHGMRWLEEIDGRITPLALDEIAGAPERETPGPVASATCGSGSAPTAVAASTENETQHGSGISRVRTGDMRTAAVLHGVMREAPPLPAYDAYLSLRELRGGAGEPLSLEEFVLGRTAVVDEYSAWLENGGTADGADRIFTTEDTERDRPQRGPFGAGNFSQRVKERKGIGGGETTGKKQR